jgi:hypothetical protein
MKLRLTLLLTLVAGGGTLWFTLLGCGGQRETPGTGEEARKKTGEVSGEKPAGKDAETKKSDSEPAPVAESFRFPDDPGGRVVARVLAPPEFLPVNKQQTQRTKPAPRSLEHPSVPLPQQIASLPRLNEGKLGRPPLPQLVTPEPLLGIEESFGALPQSLSFPALDRVKIVTPDVAVPVTLERMAQPVAEKVATTDPTLDASKAAVLSEPLPSRETPVPFLKLTLPDPFENQETGRLPATEPEALPDGTVRPPR